MPYNKQNNHMKWFNVCIKTVLSFVLVINMNSLICADEEVEHKEFDFERDTSNVIFIHPDGTGVNHWAAARTYWKGADALLQWHSFYEGDFELTSPIF